MILLGVCPLQTKRRSSPGALFPALLGLAATLAASSQSLAQQYYYYPTMPASAGQPQYYFNQPANVGYYTPQYYQPTYSAQPVQYAYAPQYYQAAQSAPPATQTPVVQTAYTTPVETTAAKPAAQPAAQPATQPAATGYGDPYGFMGWLNSVRASYGLAPVNYDPNLSNWAAMNNSQQQAYGLGHFVMGPARRQNSAMGGSFPGAMWLASPAHSAALLDPTITWFGIAAAGAYWTFNAN
jgi:hypothetical protein